MKKVDIACIVDDDPIYVYAIKRLNAIAAFCETLMVFSNGKDAYEKLSAIVKTGGVPPDVILLDINMPIWDGWQFLDEFTKIKLEKPIEIYMVSSSDDPTDIQRAKSYEEVTNFVIKPMSMEKLNQIFAEA